MLAGIWNEWVDPETGELVPSYSMLTISCDDHPLLRRLHKPDPTLPDDAQDKRAVVHVEPPDWGAWLGSSESEEFYDRGDAESTDALLTGMR